ncbi:hypothetical protein Scep_011923 [Stephania cephalantha]|uniref:Uncharacterized protein n=1 Tax=Stephania cephalantha TaxID=152367 RepID=A0AAP0JF38_9MAGN
MSLFNSSILQGRLLIDVLREICRSLSTAVDGRRQSVVHGRRSAAMAVAVAVEVENVFMCISDRGEAVKVMASFGVVDEDLKVDYKAELLKKVEQGLIPDEEIRSLIRSQLERPLSLMGIANTEEANDTAALGIYRWPASFYEIMLGKIMKMSCCYFKDESSTLEEAGIAMLELYCERAQIQDGQRVLDIGCGYGSTVFYIAHKYPNCHITGITNSVEQKYFVEEQAKKRDLAKNVEIILADVCTFEAKEQYDRILAIESFEEMKNYKLLLNKIAKWMKQDGLLFIQHMCHKDLAYIQEDDVSIVNHWIVNGTNFSRMCEEYLKNIDGNIDALRNTLRSTSNIEEETLTRLSSRMRFMCLFFSELMQYK